MQNLLLTVHTIGPQFPNLDSRLNLAVSRIAIVASCDRLVLSEARERSKTKNLVVTPIFENSFLATEGIAMKLTILSVAQCDLGTTKKVGT